MQIAKVFGNKVLLNLEKAPAVSKGGLFDPAAGKRLTAFGRVKAVGDDVTNLDVDDIVYYDIYEGWRIDSDQLITTADHIYAKVING